jgi:hypothetical protein
MAREKTLIVGSLVLLAAGVAAANNMLAGPSPNLTLGGVSVTAQSTPTTPTTTGPSTGTSTTGTTTPATVAPSTGTAGTVGATGTTATGTVGITTPSIQQIVSLSRTVEAGAAAVTAFTVPAGQQLVITDVLITNPGTTPVCGAAVSPSAVAAATATGTTTTAATTATGESGTGVLCVPAQTSLGVGLTTGLEFVAGQSVMLVNAVTAGTTTTTGGTLFFHLRGFLVATGV